MSGITPGSTTAALAGQVPKESAKNEVPGAFIETPATERDAPFGVSPIPASSGIGNPITLAPGEKVPDLQGNTIASTVKTDKESYENADSGVAPTQAAPDKSKTNIIPESSLPIGGGNTIQSVGAGSTTAALAGAVPKEPRGVPEVVSESQKEAHVDPEASANTEAVTEKKEVEAELKKTVPEEPATSESGLSAGKIAGIATGLLPLLPELPLLALLQLQKTRPPRSLNPQTQWLRGWYRRPSKEPLLVSQPSSLTL